MIGALTPARTLLSYVATHPIGSRRRLRALSELAKWQIVSRVSAGKHRHDWIEDSVLMVQRGMVGATGNIYLGLHEFADMGFVLHFLRSQDVFYDIGANVGTYTVLAGKVRGATCHSFEPDPSTAAHLRDNLIANGIGSSTMVHETALGAENGLIGFTIGLDTVNRVAEAGEQQRIVPVRRLDDVVAEHGAPALIKMDVEGHEDAVFAGARSTLADPMLLAIEAETT